MSTGDHQENTTNEKQPRAPNEIFLQFLNYLMDGDYENALKFNEIIMVHEPKNENAAKFNTLLKEKITLDNASSTDDSSSDSNSDEESSVSSKGSGSESNSDEDSISSESCSSDSEEGV